MKKATQICKVIFNPWCDGGTGMTAGDQRKWLDSHRQKIENIVSGSKITVFGHLFSVATQYDESTAKPTLAVIASWAGGADLSEQDKDRLTAFATETWLRIRDELSAMIGENVGYLTVNSFGREWE